MNRKLISLILLAVIFVASGGCGGGGGGSGRYTLPGEIPTPGDDGGGGGGGTGTTDPDALLTSAWEDFKFGAYSSAISKFNQVLSLTNSTESHKVQAYNGLGWSQAKSNGMEAGYSAFAQAASSNNEARVGLAAVLIQRAQRSGMLQAIQLLTDVGLSNVSTRFTATHPIGISNAEAHAMLAFCYFWRGQSGDDALARAQIQAARAEDASADSSVAQIYNTLKAMGLTGI